MTSADEGAEKREPFYTVDGNINCAEPLWKIIWTFLKKLKIKLPCDPSIPLLGIYPEKTNLKRYMHPSDYSNTIYNSQDVEAT